MNFLGHLYFSNNDIDMMYHNLFGDFVKGRDLSRYTPEVQKGIRLHRNIDHYIDNHPAVVELLHELYAPLPRVASVAIDLMFDHLLARNWSDYHPEKYETFLDRFHTAEFDTSLYDKEQFLFTISMMREHRWIYHYNTMYGLTKSSEGLSRRISFENNLHEAPQVFVDYEQQISKAFKIFMKDAIVHYEKYFVQMAAE